MRWRLVAILVQVIWLLIVDISSDYDLSNKYLYGERRIIDVINNIFEISSKRIPTIIGKIFRKSSI